MSTTVEMTLKDAIRGSGLTLTAVAQGAGVPIPVLSRFVAGTRSLKLTTVQKLFNYFGLRIVRGAG